MENGISVIIYIQYKYNLYYNIFDYVFIYNNYLNTRVLDNVMLYVGAAKLCY